MVSDFPPLAFWLQAFSCRDFSLALGGWVLHWASASVRIVDQEGGPGLGLRPTRKMSWMSSWMFFHRYWMLKTTQNVIRVIGGDRPGFGLTTENIEGLLVAVVGFEPTTTRI